MSIKQDIAFAIHPSVVAGCSSDVIAAAVLELFDVQHKFNEQVCVAHKRFVPCRHDPDTCILSTDPKYVEMVREYQQGSH